MAASSTLILTLSNPITCGMKQVRTQNWDEFLHLGFRLRFNNFCVFHYIFSLKIATLIDQALGLLIQVHSVVGWLNYSM